MFALPFPSLLCSPVICLWSHPGVCFHLPVRTPKAGHVQAEPAGHRRRSQTETDHGVSQRPAAEQPGSLPPADWVWAGENTSQGLDRRSRTDSPGSTSHSQVAVLPRPGQLLLREPITVLSIPPSLCCFIHIFSNAGATRTVELLSSSWLLGISSVTEGQYQSLSRALCPDQSVSQSGLHCAVFVSEWCQSRGRRTWKDDNDIWNYVYIKCLHHHHHLSTVSCNLFVSYLCLLFWRSH